MNPNNDANSPSIPVKGGDTYSYKGWLQSDKFLKRAFAVWGYNTLAQLIISVAIFLPLIVIAALVVAAGMS